jgi:hypothetical protein
MSKVEKQMCNGSRRGRKEELKKYKGKEKENENK